MKDLAYNKTHLILVNAIVEKEGKILISQRSFEEIHEPGKWTIPGGKIERTKGNVWNVIEETLRAEVEEETGIKIKDDITLLANNTFIRSTGQHVLAMIFLCHWKSGKARPLEDTISVEWISKDKIGNYEFAPNVKKYLYAGFKSLADKMPTGGFIVTGPMSLPALLPSGVTEKFNLFLFKFPNHNYYVLEKGKARERENLPVRIESACVFAHLFRSRRCDCREQFTKGLDVIGREKVGLIIYAHDQDGRGIGRQDHVRVYMLQDKGYDTVDANLKLGLKADQRNYREVIEILSWFQLKKIRLLTNNPDRINELEKAGFKVERIPFEVVKLDDYNAPQLMAKKDKLGHLFSFKTHREWMVETLELAKKGGRKVPGRPLVGCIIVRNYYEKIGEGYFDRIGGPHAEIQALKQAGKKAKGATMYINLEPHCFYGLTSPCIKAIISAGIKKVLIAMKDPHPKVDGKGIIELKKAGIAVEVGLFEDEAKLLNRAWLTQHRG